MDLLTEHAKEMLGLPDDWEGYEWEALGVEYTGKVQCLKITGAVAPIKTRGKNKGQRNWAKMDKSTKAVAYIKPDEHKVWLAAWENQTGKCCECQGFGEVFAGWNIKTGVRHKQCEKCGGSGRPTLDLKAS